MTGFVYAIAAGDLVKFGWTNSPLRRLTEVRVGNGLKCDLLGAVPATRKQERELHTLLRPYCERGEWYRRGARAVEAMVNGLRPLPPEISKREIPPGAHPLEAWRISNGVKQRDLAKQLGVGASHLSLIESRERQPSLEIAIKLSKITGLHATVFLREVLQ